MSVAGYVSRSRERNGLAPLELTSEASTQHGVSTRLFVAGTVLRAEVNIGEHVDKLNKQQFMFRKNCLRSRGWQLERSRLVSLSTPTPAIDEAFELYWQRQFEKQSNIPY